MIRLFTDSGLAAGGGVVPTPDQARYLTSVMRKDVGDEMLLFGYASEQARLFARLTSTGVPLGIRRAQELIGTAA